MSSEKVLLSWWERLKRWELAVSQLFFEWSVPPPIEWLWSIPGNWFGLPVFCMVGPLWLIYVHSNLNLLEQREREGGDGSLTTVFVWAISLTILLGICWILFLSDGGYERIMSRGIFSHYAFALGPFSGTFLCSWLTSNSDNNLSRSIGLYHILLYSSSIVPILILKHACQRYRPGVHQPNLIISGKKHLTIIPRLQTKWGPMASFPSGDATGSMCFCIPLATMYPKVAVLFLTLTLTGRMYFLAHYLGDVIVGALIPLLIHLGYQNCCSGGVVTIETCEWWQPLIAQAVFIAVGLSRRSNQK